MPNLILLDTLLKQMKKKSVIPPEVIKRINSEFERLVRHEDHLTIERYLHNKDGKRMKTVENIWKFRITGGDRILYTRGSCLAHLNFRASDIVLIGYTTHDNQAEDARKFDFTKKYTATNIHKYVSALHEYLNDGEDGSFSEEDLYDIAEIFTEEFMSNHTAFIVTEEELSKATPSELDVNPVLSQKQAICVDEFVSTPKPTLILGGAGTGKTLIALHILNDYPKDGSSLDSLSYAYFTQSEELRRNASEKYEIISSANTNASECFHEISNYCLQYLNTIPHSRLMTEHKYINDFFANLNPSLKNQCDKALIDPINSWTEIRGVIKGQLGHNWENTGNHLSEDAYLTLSDENTTMAPEQRSILWKLYEEYEKYLSTNNYYDDNDLICEANRLLDKDVPSFPTYRLLVVDEVQDYTERQIQFLSRLCPSNSIVFVGDGNQNVNPTLFQEEKLQRLFTKDYIPFLQTVYLDNNYRCPQETVSITNALSDLRRETIARGKIEREQPESSSRSGTAPFRLKATDANLVDLLTEMQKYPRTAFLVPDHKTKEHIRSLLSTEEPLPFLHTVAEIKGMEYAYVICYNLFGAYTAQWEKMLSADHSKKQTAERYYFNLPYVAMTRTQQHLGIIDEEPLPEPLVSCLSLPEKDVFDPVELYFPLLESDSDDWIQAAKENEQNGLYDAAIEYYIRGNAPMQSIRRCESKVFYQQGDIRRAVYYALLAGDTAGVKEYYTDLPKKDALHRLCDLLFTPRIKETWEQSIFVLIERMFNSDLALTEISEEELIDLRLYCVRLLHDLISISLDQIEGYITEEGEPKND